MQLDAIACNTNKNKNRKKKTNIATDGVTKGEKGNHAFLLCAGFCGNCGKVKDKNSKKILLEQAFFSLGALVCRFFKRCFLSKTVKKSVKI